MFLSVSLVSAIFANAAFWFASTLNVGVDLLAQSKWGRSFADAKLQPGRFLTKEEYIDVVVLASFNLILVAPFICVPMFELLWEALHGEDRLVAGQDPWMWKRELVRLPMDMFVNELTFYAAHYLMHRPFCYHYVHKLHHRFKAPTAMAAAYAHPIEFIFGNVLCIALGPILTNAHSYTAYFWFSAAILSTCKGHCGYNFLNAATHDAHHQHTNWNFGVLHFGDFFMGTSLPASLRTEQQSTKKSLRQMQ